MVPELDERPDRRLRRDVRRKSEAHEHADVPGVSEVGRQLGRARYIAVYAEDRVAAMTEQAADRPVPAAVVVVDVELLLGHLGGRETADLAPPTARFEEPLVLVAAERVVLVRGALLMVRKRPGASHTSTPYNPQLSSAIMVSVDIHADLRHHTDRGYTRQPPGQTRCISSGYDDAVKETHTPHRPIRVEDDLWEKFGRLAGERNRSEVVRAFIAWYVRQRGATLPKRPGSSRDD